MACRLGLAGFVVPFLFVQAPELLLLGGTVWDQWALFGAAFLGLVALNCVVVGHALLPLGPGGRVLAAAAAAGLLALEPWAGPAGAVLFFGLLARQSLLKRRPVSSRRSE